MTEIHILFISVVVEKFAGKLLVSFIHVQFYYIIWHDFQAQPISAELAAKLLGNRVAVSPIVTVEPRRRKFHKPITLTIPVPQAANKGMINQYSGDAPTLRLLCSITGEFFLSILLLVVRRKRHGEHMCCRPLVVQFCGASSHIILG